MNWTYKSAADPTVYPSRSFMHRHLSALKCGIETWTHHQRSHSLSALKKSYRNIRNLPMRPIRWHEKPDWNNLAVIHRGVATCHTPNSLLEAWVVWIAATKTMKQNAGIQTSAWPVLVTSANFVTTLSRGLWSLLKPSTLVPFLRNGNTGNVAGY